MGHKQASQEPENSKIEYGLVKVSLPHEDFLRLEELAKKQRMTCEELAIKVLRERIQRQ